MTNNFNALLTEHKAKLASIYTDNNIVKNYEALGSYQYLKNSWFPSKPVNLEEGIWNMFFMDKNNCYIHKIFFTGSESLRKTIDLTKYTLYSADPVESFGLTSANELVKKYIQQEFGDSHTTGFIEIPIKEIHSIFTEVKYIANLIELEFDLHDCHYNLKLHCHLRDKPILLGEPFACRLHGLLMMAQLYFPALLDIETYGYTMMLHNLTCNKCSETSKHKSLRNISKRVKNFLIGELPSLPSLQAQNIEINQERLEKEIERLQYHLASYTPSLFQQLDKNNTEKLQDYLASYMLYKSIQQLDKNNIENEHNKTEK